MVASEESQEMPDDPEPESGQSSKGVDCKPPDPSNVWLSLDIVEDSPLWADVSDVKTLADEAARALAQLPDIICDEPAEVCLVLTDDATLRGLNNSFRGKDRPTNVLSFPSPGHSINDGVALPSLGDVIVSYETLDREAREHNVPFAHHFQHLVVHGLLHLMGHDHQSDDEAEIMEGLEVCCLAELGISNPYLLEETA